MERLRLRVMMLVACGSIGFAVSTAGADIYAWTDENGVKYFTNQTPPEHATLFMRTPEIPHDEEADQQRRETDSLAVARQELAEREAFLLEQQQAAERRIAAAKARAEAALREADQILQDAEAVSESSNYGYSGSYGYGHYYPWYGSRSRYLYKGYKRWDGGLYRKKRYHKHGNVIKPHTSASHHKSRLEKHHGRRHSSAIRGRVPTHRARTAAFRGRHGRY